MQLPGGSLTFIILYLGAQERFHLPPQAVQYDPSLRERRPGERFSLEEESRLSIQVTLLFKIVVYVIIYETI